MSTPPIPRAAEAEDDAPATSVPRPTRFPYQPGLDGLRAVALLSIFVVHADVGLAPGGFLAVSTFFTLSGFLITALLLIEDQKRGGVDLVAFWGRRVRRLLPAATLAVLLIALATLWWGDPNQVDRIQGDVTGALAYVANWRFLFAGDAYAGEFEGQSPLLHFWSLAIEEQFYLIFPVVAGGALVLGRRWGRDLLAWVLGVGLVASLVAALVGAAGSGAVDRLYFRTDIRAAELLVGAVFGMWWVRRGFAMPAVAHRAIRASGGVLLVVMLALVATSDYVDRFWYQGGLVAYSLVTVGVVLAAIEDGGAVRRILSWRPLVAVGVVSYGAYLAHWPLFLWLNTRSDLGGAGRLVVGTAGSLILAAASYRWVEKPIRQQTLFTTPLPRIGAAVGALEANIELTAAAPGEAPTIGVFGDSTALVTSLAIARWDDTHTDIRLGPGSAALGCALASPATVFSGDIEERTNSDCDDWQGQWAVAVSSGMVDLAVVQVGPWEVRDQLPDARAEEWGELRSLGDPGVEAFLTQRLQSGIDTLLTGVPAVVLMTSPEIEPGRVDGRSPRDQDDAADPERMEDLNAIYASVAAADPRVGLVDFASYFDSLDDDARLRPDGVHLSSDTALEVVPDLATTFATVSAVAAGAPAPAVGPPVPVLEYPVNG